MEKNNFTTEISQPDFDLEGFVTRALREADFREMCIENMLTHPHIMVYYQCFYVVERASGQAPELFYPYWERIAALLDHKNSYHRDFGLIILANLTAADHEGRIDVVWPRYLRHIRDAKFMTAVHCIRGLRVILNRRPDLSGDALKTLLESDAHSPYPPNQTGLLKFELLEVIEGMDEQMVKSPEAAAFILGAAGCPSPKTRKKAKEMIRQYDLPNRAAASG